MDKICTKCGVEKSIDEFYKAGKWYRNECKECKRASVRTGIPNTGRFKKNQASWNTGMRFSRHDLRKSKSRASQDHKEWSKAVRNRDGNKCVDCGSEYRLAAHHIIPWRECEETRFDIDNGKTLCNRCHGKLEGIQEGYSPWNKGLPMSEKCKEALLKANIGKKHSEEHIKKDQNHL